MSSLTVSHWTAMEHILCYLKEAPRHGDCIRSMGITKLSAFQTQTGQDLRKT